MFTHTRSIFLKETDATGVIYFTSLFHYALEAFEVLLAKKESSLSQIFAKGYLMPIVHAEADYKAPLRVGDLITVDLSLGHVGTTSFSIESKIVHLSTGKEAGRVKIVHAFIKQGEEKASQIPADILDLLKKDFS
jgi:YbgC/YbaW family acyl-CoA thioester hydrolase